MLNKKKKKQNNQKTEKTTTIYDKQEHVLQNNANK